MRLLALLLALALSGCAVSPGCFVGVGLTGPLLICGFDLEPDANEVDEADLPND